MMRFCILVYYAKTTCLDISGGALSGKLSVVLLPRTQRGRTSSLSGKEPSQENPVKSSAHSPRPGHQLHTAHSKCSFPPSHIKKHWAD